MHTIYSVAVLAREHQAQEEKKKVSGGISSEWDHMQDKVTYGGFHDSSEEIYSMLVPLPKLHQIVTVLPSQLQQYPHLYNKHLKHCNTKYYSTESQVHELVYPIVHTETEK